MHELVYLIPLFPLAGFLLNGLAHFMRWPKGFSSWVGCGTVFLALVFALGGIAWVVQHPADTFVKEFTWVDAGDVLTTDGFLARLKVTWGFQLDALSAVMLFVVCFVGFLIHVYSVGYMAHEKGYSRYFSYLNLFMAMMLMLVLGNNFWMMFVGWEGVGLCSYLLIGFYYEKKFASDAGKKAFIVNRIGDYGFALGMLLILITFGTLNFEEVTAMAQSMAAAGGVSSALLTAICLLLFVGAAGKSAQIPLYVWLPDAMAGPTPVSALIHAATMVTSGVYMLARLNGLFSLAPTALLVVGIVGVATAFLAATIALAQNDIKKVLAYSTVSQLGYMFVACAMGAYVAAIFHLMTHAFFKACLFLGSGSVIHAMSGQQDMRHMGGLSKYLPHTYRTFLIATLAIAGIFPLAGFFSKDEILWKTFETDHMGVWVMGFVVAGMTAFYMFRAVCMTFYQNERFDDHARKHLHESPALMTVPLWILAAGSIAIGWVGWPEALGGSNRFHHWLNPVIDHGPFPAVHGHSWELILALVSVAWAVVAILLALRVYYKQSGLPARIASGWRKPIHTAMENKWYVDEIYDALFINPIKSLMKGLDWFDRWIIDGAVNFTRHFTVATSVVSKVFDLKVIDGLVNLTGWLVKGSGRALRHVQTGQAQRYAFYFILATFAMVCVFLLRR